MLTVVLEIDLTQSLSENICVLLGRSYILYTDFLCPESITDEVETHVDVIVLSRAQGVLNQRLSFLVVLKGLNAYPACLGRNERQNGVHKQSFLDSVPSRNALCL